MTPSDTPLPEGRPRLVVGITGASGAMIGVRLLERLREMAVETHLIISRAGEVAIAHETGLKLAQLRKMADFYHGANDIAAPPASGSFRTLGMVIAPCSMRSLAEIATGVTSSLLTRAADVVLKERRRLVLAVRETPFNSVHLRNMLTLSDMGAVIAPPLPAFYAHPASVDDIIEQAAARLLDLFGLDTGRFPRWGETPPSTISGPGR